MATMHQMAFAFRNSNILETTRFKLAIDYVVSSRKFSILELRGLDFAGREGDVLAPPEFRTRRGGEDADGEDDPFLNAATKLLQSYKKSLQRNNVKDHIPFDPKVDRMKANRKRPAQSQEDIEPTLKSLNKIKKQRAESRKQPETTTPAPAARMLMDGGQPDNFQDDDDAAVDAFSSSDSEMGSEGDNGPEHLQRVLRDAQYGWLDALNADDPVDTGPFKKFVLFCQLLLTSLIIVHRPRTWFLESWDQLRRRPMEP